MNEYENSPHIKLAVLTQEQKDELLELERTDETVYYNLGELDEDGNLIVFEISLGYLKAIDERQGITGRDYDALERVKCS